MNDFDSALTAGAESFLNTSNPVLAADAVSLNILFANRAAADFYGYGPDEITAVNLADIDGRTAAFASRGRARDSVFSKTVFEHNLKNGSVKNVKLAFFPARWKGAPAVIISVTDVTALAEACAALEERKKRNDFFFETTMDSVIISEGGVITGVNPALTSIFGWTKEDMEGKSMASVLEGDGAAELYRAAASLSSCRGEALMRHKDGRVMNVMAGIMRPACGTVSVMTVRDITEYRTAEKVISANRQYIQDILDAQGAIVSVWEEGRIADCNKRFADFFRIRDVDDFMEIYPVPDTVLTGRRGCVSADDWPAFISTLLESRKKGVKSKIAVKPYGANASRVFTADVNDMEGNMRYVISMSDITDIDNYNSMLIETNLNLEKEIEAVINKTRRADTEIQSKEDILIQQSKIAVMGEMIGIVAHQWKQPLNVISVLNQDMEFYFNEGRLNGDMVESCTQGINRQIVFMTDTINSFANFFRPGDHDGSFKVISACKAVERLLGPPFRKNGISVEFSMSGEPFSDVIVKGSSNGFKQIVMNMFVNSKDAIFSMREKKPDMPGIIKVTAKLSEGRVILGFLDNGGGIDPEYMDKVFDNYFTSKGDKGTGIGLHLCKMLVKNMNGELAVSNKDGGAEFTVKLPAARVIK